MKKKTNPNKSKSTDKVTPLSNVIASTTYTICRYVDVCMYICSTYNSMMHSSCKYRVELCIDNFLSQQRNNVQRGNLHSSNM